MSPHRIGTFALSLLVVLGCGDDDSDGAGGQGTTSAATGGTTSTSGVGGQASSTTASSSSSSGQTTGSGGMSGSAGCGMASAEATETWLAKTVDVGGTTREYFVYLPSGYDENLPYPIVYQFHGCSGSVNKENNNPPVQSQSGTEAIHVRGRAVADCWDLAANGPDVAFFDALVVELESNYCADSNRRFATGYSSGAFMTHRLSCDRGDQLRGVASIAGGLGGNNCVGRTAALLIHDDTDPTVGIGTSESARDRHLTNNGCGMTSTPVSPTPCVSYDGCDAGYPVVWCQTTGQGHARQDGLSAPAFWDFLQAL